MKIVREQGPITLYAQESGDYKLTVKVRREKEGGGMLARLTYKGELVRHVPTSQHKNMRELFADVWGMCCCFGWYRVAAARVAVEELAANLDIPTNEAADE